MASGVIKKIPERVISRTLPSGATVYLHHNDVVILTSDRGGMWVESAADRSFTTIASSDSLTVSKESQQVLKIVSKAGGGSRLLAVSYSNMYFSDTP